MGENQRLTYKNRISYTNGEALQCQCGKLIAYIREGKIYVKCRGCGREIEVRAESR